MRDKIIKLFTDKSIEFLEVLSVTPAKGSKMLDGGWSKDQYQVCKQYKTLFQNIKAVAAMHNIHELASVVNPASDALATMETPDYDETPTI